MKVDGRTKTDFGVGKKKPKIKMAPLNLILISAAIIILVAVSLGSISMNDYLPFLGRVIGGDPNTEPSAQTGPGAIGATCESGKDCYPNACHEGVCTENCVSHGECGGPETGAYFCNFENKCAYEGVIVSKLLCSDQIGCKGCGTFNSLCDKAPGSTCMKDEFTGDGAAYCAQSPFCVIGPSHVEDRGFGNLIFGTAIIPNYVKCKGNTAYRCIGYGQTEDPHYNNDDKLWAITKCKGGETCVEGLDGDGGGCIPGRRRP
jgi:hypothetical protein